MSKCGSDVAGNPFAGRNVGRGNLTMFDVKNPIPDETRDDRAVSLFFKREGLVPFAGHDGGTGDKTLAWYIMLARLSPTFGACSEKMASYVIGSRARVERAESPDFETEPGEVSESERAAWQEVLSKTVTYADGLVPFHEKAYKSYKATGNAFAELSVATVGGVTQAVVTFHKTSDVRYKYPKGGGDAVRAVAISKVWDSAYLKKNPAKVRPVWPAVLSEGGAAHTVFHLKAGDNDWYGRPDSDAVSLDKYREVQDLIYLTKQSAANFVGQLIIEIEEDVDPVIDNEAASAAGFESFAQRMEQNFTMKGEDPQSILVASRPIGARPMFVFQVKPNTNQDWYKVTGEIHRDRIIAGMQLTKRFMGIEAGAGLSDTAFLEDYITNIDPVIRRERERLMGWANGILSAVWELGGMQQMNAYSLTFASPIEAMIEAYKQKDKGNANSPD